MKIAEIRQALHLSETSEVFSDKLLASKGMTAELLYQSISYRWVENMRGFEGQEVGRFTAYYDQVTNQPVMVASAVVVVGD